MSNRHEADPRFLDSLERQLGSELRRRRRTPVSRTSVRVLKIVALVLGSIVVGAAAMGAKQQLDQQWRKELLENRLRVQLELAQQHAQMRRQALEESRQRFEAGATGPEELAFGELAVAEAEMNARIMELELEEIRRSGRRPLGEISSPLVDDRDFVSEKIQARMEVARLRIRAMEEERQRELRRRDAHAVDQRQIQAYDLALAEARSHLESLVKRLELRRAYLQGEISATQAELMVIAAETEGRAAVLVRQRDLVQSELEHLGELVEDGEVSPFTVAQVRTHMAQVEADLGLAQTELEIVRRELRRIRGDE